MHDLSGFAPSNLASSPNGEHWFLAGKDSDGPCLVVDGLRSETFEKVLRPIALEDGRCVCRVEIGGDVAVVVGDERLGPFARLTSFIVNGSSFAFVNRSKEKGKNHFSVFIDGEILGTYVEPVELVPDRVNGGFLVQVDSKGQTGLPKEHKGKILLMKDGEVIASGLQYVTQCRDGFVWLETGPKGFHLVRNGERISAHDWMMPAAARIDSDNLAWLGRDGDRWRVYVNGEAQGGDYDDAGKVDVAPDGSFVASVQDDGAWWVISPSRRSGPFNQVSTVSAWNGGRVAYVARDEEGLVVGVDETIRRVSNASVVEFDAHGELAYSVSTGPDEWSAVVDGVGEVGPFERVSLPVKSADGWVTCAFIDGHVQRTYFLPH